MNMQRNSQLHYQPSSAVYGTPPTAGGQLSRALAPQHPFLAKRARFDHDPYYEEEDVGDAQQQYFAPIFPMRRSTDKTRGLRHFAHKVCEKVKEKVQTNYNEVADELVTEYFDQLADAPTDPEKFQYDARNIRRRVYDALNVLMAMNIIEKEKKEIRWVGLPTSSLAECRRLEEERAQRQERIRQKTEQLQELIVQLVAYKSLVQRNRERERLQGRPPDSSILYLPYIIVSTDKKTLVECAIAPDKSEYWFNFDRPFEIHDDIEVLKRLGLAYGIHRGEVEPAHVPHIKACLPPALRDYVDQILEGTLNTQPALKHQEGKFNSQYEKKSLVKLDPNSETVRAAPSDSIIVRATRANLSGVAPGGDGGPMGSFLGPVVAPAPPKPNPQVHRPPSGATPMARYAVIPRPVISARYSSSAYSSSVGRYQMMANQQQMHHRGVGGQRLGGILHDQYEDYQDLGQHQQEIAYIQQEGMGEGDYPMEGEEVEQEYGQIQQQQIGNGQHRQLVLVRHEDVGDQRQERGQQGRMGGEGDITVDDRS